MSRPHALQETLITVAITLLFFAAASWAFLLITREPVSPYGDPVGPPESIAPQDPGGLQ